MHSSCCSITIVVVIASVFKEISIVSVFVCVISALVFVCEVSLVPVAKKCG